MRDLPLYRPLRLSLLRESPMLPFLGHFLQIGEIRRAACSHILDSHALNTILYVFCLEYDGIPRIYRFPLVHFSLLAVAQM